MVSEQLYAEPNHRKNQPNQFKIFYSIIGIVSG